MAAMSDSPSTTAPRDGSQAPPPDTAPDGEPQPEGASQPADRGDSSGAAAAGRSDDTTPELIVEALLFSTNEPLSAGKIAKILGIGDAGDVKQHVKSLNERFEQAGNSFRIESIAKGYQMLTLPAFHPWVGQLHKIRAESRLSAAALETLAV
ncbi:MAG: SMC-Scp complex subunit ScpB, partial [Phycisphaerae bacterium]